MPLSWKRKSKPKRSRKEEQQERVNRIAWDLYENRFSHNKKIDKDNIWTIAKHIAASRLKRALFACNRPLIKLEKFIWEPTLAWADNQALLSLLGIVGNVGLIIAVGMYIGSEKQRRDTEVLNAWQTLTNTHGQAGNGGRIHALEFLNASPRNKEYNYPGANWRRRASCLWICTWPSESLAGIDLSTATIEIPEPDTKKESFNEPQSDVDPRRVYLARVQLPWAALTMANLERANLWAANLKGATLTEANLEKATLTGANLERATLWKANLERADLREVKLQEAFLLDTNLEGANLRAANLERANLREANLEGTNLREANLEGTNLREANLEETFLEKTFLEKANLREANLEEVFLTGANFFETDLERASLKEAFLLDASFEGAQNITQKQISKAKLCRTKLPLDISLDPNRDCKELGINPETGAWE